MLGFQANDLLTGKVNYADMVHPQDLARVIKEVDFFTEKGVEHFTQEYRMLSPSGQLFWVDDKTTIERSDDGSVALYQGIIIDITDKKQAEIELEQSNTLIKNVINSTPDLIYAKNTDHQYILANNAFAHYLKQPVEFFIGKTDKQLGFSNEQINKFKIEEQEILNGNSIPISSCRTFYDDNKVVDASKFPLRKDNGEIEGIIYVGHDVTENIDNLIKISEQQKELTQTIDAIFDAVITINDLGLIQSCNRATGLMFGYSTEELIGKNVSLLMPDNVASQHDDYINNHLKTGENKIIGKGRELVGINKNQIEFPLLLTIAELPENLDERKRFVGVCHDLSKIKQHEKRLNRTQKMEALGQLTGGIAHDYNNVLGVILGYSDILKSQLQEQPALFDFVDQINQAGNRGAKLTRKLLSFSRQSPESSQESNLNNIVKNNKDVLRKTLLSVELRLNLNDDISQVDIDQNSFEDVLLNMAINAMHAMPEGGVLTLSTREVTLSKEQASSFNVHQGKYVQLSIEDNGSGMSQTVQDKIFEPFFSTKGEQGSGLGLSQVYGFMKSSLGAINVYSELGEGTRFSLYFPVVKTENKTENIDENINENLNVAGNETILVVDDEPQLRTLAQTILMEKGYRVLTAENGIEALDVLEKNAIDLLFSDIIMPKMNGYLLVEKAQKLYPTLKILLASGFQGDQVGNKIKLDEAIIEKPYDNNFLLSRVRNCLDKQNADIIEYHKQETKTNSNENTQKSAEILQVTRLLWTDEMSIDDGGILDTDHQFMCILLNRCQDLLTVEDFHQPLQEIITELVEYTQQHFAREELAMKRCHYPYTKNHCDVHQMIVKQLTQKLKSCSDKEILLWLCTEMCEWLIDHFIVMDKPLHKYIVKSRELEGNVLKAHVEGDDNDQ
ncbi:PAS domain S-box protein [Colwellia demingiae]|uniref:Sensor protein FixL n=1 Tax=Colwellia demingiae TaxID=89401 RepID=A0A5C6QT15_9GAMM|nr:PAS domain S-box protein [Colwellia demingiae]TWX72019.1 PAS domain S-box protein [Colwellia demingiae]